MSIYQGNKSKDVLNQTGSGPGKADQSSEEGELSPTILVECQGIRNDGEQ